MRSPLSRTVLHVAALVTLGFGLSGPSHALTCTPGPFIIFFDSGRAQVDRDGLEILDDAVRQAGNCGSGRTMIAGFTDTDEDSKLARERGDVVRAYFLAHGFARRDITVHALGTTKLRIATGPGIAERQNRRVEITYGPAFPTRH